MYSIPLCFRKVCWRRVLSTLNSPGVAQRGTLEGRSYRLLLLASPTARPGTRSYRLLLLGGLAFLSLSPTSPARQAQAFLRTVTTSGAPKARREKTGFEHPQKANSLGNPYVLKALNHLVPEPPPARRRRAGKILGLWKLALWKRGGGGTRTRAVSIP